VGRRAIPLAGENSFETVSRCRAAVSTEVLVVRLAAGGRGVRAEANHKFRGQVLGVRPRLHCRRRRLAAVAKAAAERIAKLSDAGRPARQKTLA